MKCQFYSWAKRYNSFIHKCGWLFVEVSWDAAKCSHIMYCWNMFLEFLLFKKPHFTDGTFEKGTTFWVLLQIMFHETRNSIQWSIAFWTIYVDTRPFSTLVLLMVLKRIFASSNYLETISALVSIAIDILNISLLLYVDSILWILAVGVLHCLLLIEGFKRDWV